MGMRQKLAFQSRQSEDRTQTHFLWKMMTVAIFKLMGALLKKRARLSLSGMERKNRAS
jgi:hypothetical protein